MNWSCTVPMCFCASGGNPLGIARLATLLTESWGGTCQSEVAQKWHRADLLIHQKLSTWTNPERLHVWYIYLQDSTETMHRDNVVEKYWLGDLVSEDIEDQSVIPCTACFGLIQKMWRTTLNKAPIGVPSTTCVMQPLRWVEDKWWENLFVCVCVFCFTVYYST